MVGWLRIRWRSRQCKRQGPPWWKWFRCSLWDKWNLGHGGSWPWHCVWWKVQEKERKVHLSKISWQDRVTKRSSMIAFACDNPWCQNSQRYTIAATASQLEFVLWSSSSIFMAETCFLISLFIIPWSLLVSCCIQLPSRLAIYCQKGVQN